MHLPCICCRWVPCIHHTYLFIPAIKHRVWGCMCESQSSPRVDSNMCCLCAQLGAACPLQFPKHGPVPTGVTQVLHSFYHLHMHHSSIFFARLWARLFSFPQGNWYFSRGGHVCAFSAHALHFGLVNAPLCLAMEAGQPSWVSLSQLEVLGFCRKGIPPL